ncbi:hypothetical protein CYMTET_47804 [Cymbomonas tetramitiformis]|uniref:Uncharacterized protein n=1 Tax=Cymbomonas tetramitiformis TaxID=36881 RepID=A0AAE0BTH7_9CHLO|nr:hypothetical protein CYMTET_47804 [Cymbomonas tetramitiformis]
MDERKVATAKALKGLFDEGVLNEIDFKREKTKLFSSPYVLNPTVIDGLRESKELLDLEVLDMAEYSRAKQSFLDATTFHRDASVWVSTPVRASQQDEYNERMDYAFSYGEELVRLLRSHGFKPQKGFTLDGSDAEADFAILLSNLRHVLSPISHFEYDKLFDLEHEYLVYHWSLNELLFNILQGVLQGTTLALYQESARVHPRDGRCALQRLRFHVKATTDLDTFRFWTKLRSTVIDETADPAPQLTVLRVLGDKHQRLHPTYGDAGRVQDRVEVFQNSLRPVNYISAGPLSAKTVKEKICPPQARIFEIKYGGLIKSGIKCLYFLPKFGRLKFLRGPGAKAPSARFRPGASFCGFGPARHGKTSTLVQDLHHVLGRSAASSPHVSPLYLVVLRELAAGHAFTFSVLLLRLGTVWQSEGHLARLRSPSSGSGGGKHAPASASFNFMQRNNIVKPVGDWKPPPRNGRYLVWEGVGYPCVTCFRLWGLTDAHIPTRSVCPYSCAASFAPEQAPAGAPAAPPRPTIDAWFQPPAAPAPAAAAAVHFAEGSPSSMQFAAADDSGPTAFTLRPPLDHDPPGPEPDDSAGLGDADWPALRTVPWIPPIQGAAEALIYTNKQD